MAWSRTVPPKTLRKRTTGRPAPAKTAFRAAKEADNGTQTGYFMNTRANGDIDRGTFTARVTTADGATTMEGTWKHSGGTGAFSKITGNGTYKGRITSPSEVEVSWEGTYDLG